MIQYLGSSVGLLLTDPIENDLARSTITVKMLAMN